MKPNILLVDDEPAIHFGFSEYLSAEGYALHGVHSLAEAREAVSGRRFDAVLLDLRLPDGSGIDWIPDLREMYPDIAIVVITGHGGVPLAVDAMRRGADNFLTKPVDMEDLEVFLRKSLELGKLRRGHSIQQRLGAKDEPRFGESPAIRKVMELARLAAESESAVLLQGDTGTGKGVLAKWIHEHSSRASAPVVEVNCSSLRGDLLASELFGHAKGAFTSAVEDKQGLIEVADGGTLFLDEIADMDVGVQAQFLKVVEEKRFRRLGEVKERASDFRLICATNRDLQGAADHGQFRRDLYFRINVFAIALPPLRERREDIAGLVHHLIQTFSATNVAVSDEGMQLLETYRWPGNVRELRNVLERAIILARGLPLSPAHFPGLETPDVASEDTAGDMDLGKHEEAHIRRVLDQFNGDTKKAAEALGISRAAVYRKLKKLRGEAGD